MVITAFEHERDLYAMGFPLWFHEPQTLEHFHLLFTQTWFATWVVNTTLALVYPTFTIPFCMGLMAGFFRAVPPEIEEAAWIDGCGVAGSA